jgi:hypothetical protein
MKVNIRLTAYINEADLPMSLTDPEYLEEVIRENIQDVFIGADINDIDIEWLVVDKQED